MKVTRLELNNFMLFRHLDLTFSSGINVICGDNSTGKTALLKSLYTILQAYCKIPDDAAKEEIEKSFGKKFQGVFRPDQNSIGRLVSRKPGNLRADLKLSLDGGRQIAVDFANRSSKRANVSFINLDTAPKSRVQPVYLPPKEIISATENFTSLYDEFHIAFEETYYDLAKLLDRPLKKSANSAEQNQVLEKFESIMCGKVTQRDKKFFLNVQDTGEFEMGLVSEGFRKLATIQFLLQTNFLLNKDCRYMNSPISAK